MTDLTNKAVVRAYFEKLFNHGDISAADEIFAPDIQFHYPLGDLSGVAETKIFVTAVRTAFPDLHFTIADLFGEGDRVAARWSFSGSQTGPFRGRAPTGNQVSLPGNTVFHVRDGNIHEVWIAFDPELFVSDK